MGDSGGGDGLAVGAVRRDMSAVDLPGARAVRTHMAPVIPATFAAATWPGVAWPGALASRSIQGFATSFESWFD